MDGASHFMHLGSLLEGDQDIFQAHDQAPVRGLATKVNAINETAKSMTCLMWLLQYMYHQIQLPTKVSNCPVQYNVHLTMIHINMNLSYIKLS